MTILSHIEKVKEMKMNHGKSASVGLFLTLLLCGFMIFPGAAVLVIANANDPYARTCVFDAAPGEPIVYLTDYQGQDGMKSYRFSDLMIGEYIRDTYPDIWEKLSPEDQEFYNSRAAVWLAGAEEPVLPDIVQKLLWENQAATGTLFLQTDELTSPAPAVSPETGFSSRFMEMRSTVSSGAMPDPGARIAAWQGTAGSLSLHENEPASPVSAVSMISDHSSRLAIGNSRLLEVRSTGSSGEIFDSGNLITAWQATRQAHLGRTLP